MTSASVPECKCSLRTSLVGDGCSVCNPEMAARIDAENAANDRLHDAAPDLLAIVERFVQIVNLCPPVDLMREIGALVKPASAALDRAVKP
ncbi:MAG: hypothetical protein JWQ01_4848 [Massilia sp.]|nr:hypothetical protein [Massilia sp.]